MMGQWGPKQVGVFLNSNIKVCAYVGPICNNYIAMHGVKNAKTRSEMSVNIDTSGAFAVIIPTIYFRE